MEYSRSGSWGGGIAQIFAESGYNAALCDVDHATAEQGYAEIAEGLRRAVLRSRMSHRAAEQTIARITPAANRASLANCRLLIEAIPEDLDTKRRTLRELARIVEGEVVLTTDTSALPITAIATAVPEPERMVGLHLFKPVPRMHLVELVGTTASEKAEQRARQLYESVGNVVVCVADRPGFVTSRINALIGN